MLQFHVKMIQLPNAFYMRNPTSHCNWHWQTSTHINQEYTTHIIYKHLQIDFQNSSFIKRLKEEGHVRFLHVCANLKEILRVYIEVYLIMKSNNIMNAWTFPRHHLQLQWSISALDMKFYNARHGAPASLKSKRTPWLGTNIIMGKHMTTP